MAAPDGKLWLIIAGEAAMLWRLTASGRFEAVDWVVEEEPVT